jgi:hypothetical protein
MIKKMCAFSVMLFSGFSFAQNTFPATGSVGVGTTTPLSILDVRAPLATGTGFVSSQSHFRITDNKGITRLDYTASNANNSGGGALTLSSKNGSVDFFLGDTGAVGNVMRLSQDYRFILGETINRGLNYNMYIKGLSRFNNDTYFDSKVFLTGATPIIGTNGSVTIPTFPTTAGSINVSGYKLFVKGGILTEEIRVALASTWADYVFKKDYKLPSLQAVEKHIQEKGHLINVPSADEVATSGINLGEMSKIQQEKIEELTLYIIAQNKINEKQAKEIAELKAMVKKIAAKK